jgi:5-hydroxyisourate hydrolase
VADLVSTTLRLQAGTYRLTFDVATYFRSHNLTSLYPEIIVVFSIRDTGQHYHIPLLLSPYGYTVYRGS